VKLARQAVADAMAELVAEVKLLGCLSSDQRRYPQTTHHRKNTWLMEKGHTSKSIQTRTRSIMLPCNQPSRSTKAVNTLNVAEAEVTDGNAGAGRIHGRLEERIVTLSGASTSTSSESRRRRRHSAPAVGNATAEGNARRQSGSNKPTSLRVVPRVSARSRDLL